MMTDWALVADAAATVGTIITIILIVVWNWKQHSQMERQLKIQNEQLKTQTEQIKLDFFSEFTKRYQEILLHFPENVNEDDFSYEELRDKKPEDTSMRDMTMRYMRIYFDLCSEEFFLHENGHIDDKVWKEWEKGMIVAFNKPAFRTAWNEVIKKSGYYRDFMKFVDSRMASGSN